MIEPSDRSTVERHVLEVVTRLVGELRGAGPLVPVTLDDSLERHLGISSLERVELLLRLEQRLGVRLPDRVMGEAERVVDLVAAIASAEPSLPEASHPPHPVVPSGVAAPASVTTLVDVLRWHVERTPERTHIFLREDDGREREITYHRLWDGAASIAAELRGKGIRPGDRVALMLRTEQAFFDSFFGTLLAGAVPVPIYPPFRADRIEEYARRQAGILRNAEARLLITFAQAERVARFLRADVPTLDDVSSVDRLAGTDAGIPLPRASSDDVALIQYTSGSTGDPKGVVLTHANILANIRAIGEALAIGPDDVAVSWLPLYHDMGLIGAWLGALRFGIPLAVLSPLAFLSRPARWLQTIHVHHGSISPAPNFAFELCARKIADEEIRGLDLSSWRLALNGSEMVSPDTIARFLRRFEPYGVRPEAMCPVYGLAESSVALAATPISRGARIDRIARQPFEQARTVRAAPDDETNPLQFVSCGVAIPGHEIRIVDETDQPVGERVEGRIEFRGPSVTHGYYRNPAATEAALRNGWFDSGDLGYWADGELFITGRRKDVIIQGGRNIYPQEVEDIVGAVDGMRPGCVAAFGVADPSAGTERLVVVAETRETDVTRYDALRAAVVDALATELGVPPDVVVICRPGTILKTSSGKIRRNATRDAYLTGELTRERRAVSVQWASLAVVDLVSRLRRGLGRTVSILYTTLVALILATGLPLLAIVLVLLPSPRAAGRFVRRWSRVALALSGCRLRVAGLEHLPAEGPAVLVANHASYVDSVVVMAALPAGFRFVAKRALASYPFIGLVIRKVGHLTIEKAQMSSRLEGADQVSHALKRGEVIFVFPEGTFLRPPGLLPFRLGAFRAAVDAGCPVVPIALRGTRDVLPDGTWIIRRGPIDVTIGRPISPQESGWPEMVRLRNLARDEIAGGCGEPAVDV